MLRSSITVAFMALAAIPGALGRWNGNATPGASSCWEDEMRKCPGGRCLNGLVSTLATVSGAAPPAKSRAVLDFARTCDTERVGVQRGRFQLRSLAEARLTKADPFTSSSGACWCTNQNTVTFTPGNRPDKRDVAKVYKVIKA
ncbi:hypothetical protein CTA2_5339 [Colletotrichum tanaceti]|nr:hypothetical protein CTA2_5339 [Colletotrichum tanaceti]